MRFRLAQREITPTNVTFRIATLGNCFEWAFGKPIYQAIGRKWCIGQPTLRARG
jgi:hypothetical protein